MPDHERSFRQWRDYQYAVRNPASAWSRQVITDVLDVRREAAAAASTSRATAAAATASPSPLPDATSAAAAAVPAHVGPPLLDAASALAAFKSARRRLLVLDYGGTIMNREATSRADFTVDGYRCAVFLRVVRVWSVVHGSVVPLLPI